MQQTEVPAASARSKPDQSAASAQKRKWYRFSLRALLLLFGLVALGAVCWNNLDRQRRAVLALQKFGVKIRYDDKNTSGIKDFLRKCLPRDYVDDVQSVSFYQPEKDTTNWDAMMPHIAALEKLDRLVLFCNISDAGAVHLQNLSKLRHLDLSNTRLTNQGVGYLSELHALEYLRLPAKTGIGDSGLLALNEMRSLQQLEIEGANLTDAGLAKLQLPVTLKKLNLRSTQITDAGLSQLSHLTALDRLDLGYTKVTGSGLPQLAKLTSLISLSLDGKSLEDQYLVHLSLIPSLNHLSMGTSQITDQGLANLNGLPNLKTLLLIGSAITDAGILHLVKLPSLRHVYLDKTKVTTPGFQALRAKMPGLGGSTSN